jgi:hypothetical protein
MEEIWKDVPGYEGLYQVSNIGNIKSLPKRRVKEDKILKFNINVRHNYASVVFTKDGIKKSLRVNRLVALAFIPNPKNKCFVNHIDSNRLNNRIENLEWVTVKENSEHALKNGRVPIGECSYFSKLTNEQAKYIKYSNKSPKELLREFNISSGAIYHIIRGRTWKHI